MATSVRFWRAALWGFLTFLLFCISFRYAFHAFIGMLIARSAQSSWILPGPLLPALIGAVFSLLLVLIWTFACWKFQFRREPPPSRPRFASHKGNAGLLVRLMLLVVFLAMGSSFPYSSHIITTCRCCSFTGDAACRKYQDVLPASGSYNFSTPDGWNGAVYPAGQLGKLWIGNAWLDKFSFEQVDVERTRFGWPLRAITRDAIPRRSGWHIVIEIWLNVSLFFLFLGWLCVQAAIATAKGWVRRPRLSLSEAKQKYEL